MGFRGPSKQIFPRKTRHRIFHDHNTSSILIVGPIGEKVNALLELFINLAEFNVIQFQFRVATTRKNLKHRYRPFYSIYIVYIRPHITFKKKKNQICILKYNLLIIRGCNHKQYFNGWLDKSQTIAKYKKTLAYKGPRY